jgi:hypothetical protein
MILYVSQKRRSGRAIFGPQIIITIIGTERIVYCWSPGVDATLFRASSVAGARDAVMLRRRAIAATSKKQRTNERANERANDDHLTCFVPGRSKSHFLLDSSSGNDDSRTPIELATIQWDGATRHGTDTPKIIQNARQIYSFVGRPMHGLVAVELLA